MIIKIAILFVIFIADVYFYHMAEKGENRNKRTFGSIASVFLGIMLGILLATFFPSILDFLPRG